MPYLTTSEQWDQYNDEVVYQADKLTREFIQKMADSAEWTQPSIKKQNECKAFTFAQLFQTLYGISYLEAGYNKYTNKIARVFAYYSSSITKTKKNAKGKWSQKTCYHLSVTRLKQPPYSLKLRLEYMMEQGLVPKQGNMKLPKDDLKPGHSRNPRTDLNQQRRSEEAKRRYNERYHNKGTDEKDKGDASKVGHTEER